ncbi:MAG: alpha/beta hydrolase family protein [Myxococcota bacterium]
MDAAPSLPYDTHEPLGLSTGPASAPVRWPALRASRFEFTSRGDRVPGRLLLPPKGDGPFPTILLQHGAGGSKQSDYIEYAAGPWVQRGAAVASIDFPLHGERASAKLSERLVGGIRGFATQGADAAALIHEFFRQAVSDLRRTVDALERLPQADVGRLGYASFSMGTLVGASFWGVDRRPRAAAFAIGGGGVGPPDIDPARTIAGFAPRPALFLNTTRDEIFPRAMALALFDGCGEPKQQLWFEGTHRGLPGAAMKAIWLFLQRHLEIP